MAQHNSQTPPESRDLWATPKWLFDWLNNEYNFDIDLASNAENAKCYYHLTEKDDALNTDWMDYAVSIPLSDATLPIGFLNPPYSKIAPWVHQAISEMDDGFSTVMVIPCPNGESYYEEVFNRATRITFIHGRISFEASCDYEKIVKVKGKPDKVIKIKKGDLIAGNTRGTCIVEFKANTKNCIVNLPQQIVHVHRDDILELYGEII